MKIDIHEHELYQHPLEEINNDNWACNGMELFENGCYGGITAYGQTSGVEGWICPLGDPRGAECDFDLCKSCV